MLSDESIFASGKAGNSLWEDEADVVLRIVDELQSAYWAKATELAAKEYSYKGYQMQDAQQLGQLAEGILHLRKAQQILRCINCVNVVKT